MVDRRRIENRRAQRATLVAALLAALLAPIPARANDWLLAGRLDLKEVTAPRRRGEFQLQYYTGKKPGPGGQRWAGWYFVQGICEPSVFIGGGLGWGWLTGSSTFGGSVNGKPGPKTTVYTFSFGRQRWGTFADDYQCHVPGGILRQGTIEYTVLPPEQVVWDKVIGKWRTATVEICTEVPPSCKLYNAFSNTK